MKQLSELGATLKEFFGPTVKPGLLARMAAVFTTRLWTRVWIVQELSCARNVVLLAGNESLSWEALSRFLAPKPDLGVHHFPWDRGVLASVLAGILYRVAEMDKQRAFRNRADDKSTLLDILARFCDRESSDPRDRVYGLLGLLPQHPTHRRLEVDYSIPSARLFVEVTAEVIHQSQNLDILCQSPWERRGVPQCTRLGRRTEALPSWAVDFAARELSWNVGDSYRSREIMFAGDKIRRIFSAGGDFSDGSWSFPDDDKQVLQLRGYLLGQIGPPQAQPPVDITDLMPGI